VEPSTLQSLQQLIQWVADLALNPLARLPEQRMRVKAGGVGTSNTNLSENYEKSFKFFLTFNVYFF
jgi:hypothetical protein